MIKLTTETNPNLKLLHEPFCPQQFSEKQVEVQVGLEETQLGNQEEDMEERKLRREPGGCKMEKLGRSSMAALETVPLQAKISEVAANFCVTRKIETDVKALVFTFFL